MGKRMVLHIEVDHWPSIIAPNWEFSLRRIVNMPNTGKMLTIIKRLVTVIPNRPLLQFAANAHRKLVALQSP